MDIRRVGFDRPRDQLVHEPDDGCLARQILEPFRVLLRRLGIGGDLIQFRLGVLLPDIGIQAVESGFELDRDRNRHGYGPAERCRNGTAGEGIERIGHRESSPVIGRGNRQRARPAQEFSLQPVVKERRLRIIRGRDKRRRDQPRQGLSETAIAYHPELSEDLVEPATRLGRDTTRPVQGSLVYRPAVDEGGAEHYQQVRGVPSGGRSDRLQGHNGFIPQWKLFAGDLGGHGSSPTGFWGEGKVFGLELLDRMADAGTAGWSLVMAAPFVGSFLGVIVRRLPDGLPIAWARSGCDWCGVPLRARDLVPIVGWLAARGRCRYCDHSLGWFYPGIELAAIAVALTAVLADVGTGAWLDCLLGWWLLTLAWIDIRSWLLPDLLTLPLVLTGLGAAAVFDPEQLTNRSLGAVLGYLSLTAIAAIYRSLRHREGLGGGDAKLLAAAGAWVGAAALPQVILVAALSALAAAGCLRLAGIRLGAQSALPFGPFLGLATWVLWLGGAIFI